MRKTFFTLLLLGSICSYSQTLVTRSIGMETPPYHAGLITHFEFSKGLESPPYPEVVDYWKKIDASSAIVTMQAMGPTDAGLPLQLILVSPDKDFDIASLKKKGKNIILVNNGIHPGEPDGIDASMLLVRDIIQNKYKLPSNVVLGIIACYNIGGAFNRSVNYRIDQNGPIEKGFRGNAENLDLNRDFIKADSKNAMSFTRIFQYLDPDVFVDNHVSNGADYQHIMTLLTSQHNKLGGSMGEFMNKVFEPGLYDLMKQKGFDLVPYVNHFGETPDKGWNEFWDSPRYGSGYGTLWSSFSFVPETHMLKPYALRVQSTKALMESFIEFTGKYGKDISELRATQRKAEESKATLPIAWKWDRTKSTEITFKGYEAGHKLSDVSGLPRLYYDRQKPFEKKVPFYNVYADTFSIEKPKAYVIPQGWWKVIDRLEANNVQMRRLTRDSTIEVESYRIESYQSSPRPYEGHHVNSNVQVSKTMKKVTFRKGDYFIPLDQKAARFLVETLEPQAEDSYFAWNFFDPILGQKEGYSNYVFEETAAAYLQSHPEVKEALEKKKQEDPNFAKNGAAQLDFVFKNSQYYEPSHMQYPVYRVK